MDNMFGSVASRSEAQIEKLADALRRELGVGPGARIALQPILEFALDDMVPGAFFTVENDSDLGGAEGRTDWAQPKIALSASTYAQLRKSDDRARMTVAHELGHLLMHTQQPVYHFRSKSRDHHVDPEWQANYFAGALLMPRHAFRKMKTVRQVRQHFGVSRGAALKRARVLSHPLVDDMVRRSSTKKKGRSVSHVP